MATVQGLRAKAAAAGNLKSTPEVAVKTEQAAGKTVYVVESVKTEVVYVPTYNPSTIYGTWWYPAPPYYMYPQAYVYPPGMRETRDLLRRRLHLVRKRGQLLAHLQNLRHTYNRGAFAKRIAYPSNRKGVVAHFAGEPMVQANAALDLSLLDHYDKLLVDLELRLVRKAKKEAPHGFHLLLSIPGIGKVLAMTIVYELHDVHRFERVQQFASYARLVKCAKESAGKRKGTGGAKMGNVHLKWAFSEAAVLFVRHSAEAKALLARLTQRHGKGKALSILAHKIGRAAYYVLVREKPFDAAKFFAHAS